MTETTSQMEEAVRKNEHRIDEVCEQMKLLEIQLQNQQKAHSDFESRVESKLDKLLKINMAKIPMEEGDSPSDWKEEHMGNIIHYNPKFLFPVFDGSDPRTWIRKCNKYFALHPTMTLEDKLQAIDVNVEGRAEIWFQNLLESGRELSWEVIVDETLNYFREHNKSHLVREFNKLRQHHSVDEYIHQFETLRGLMLSKYKQFDDEYYVQSFISGLNDEIAKMVLLLNPRSLGEAMYMARVQQGNLDSTPTTISYKSNPNLPSNHPKQRPPNPNFKKLTYAEMRSRRERGLCFNCDEQFQLGHRCKNNQHIFMMMPDEDNEAIEEMLGLNAVSSHALQMNMMHKAENKYEVSRVMDEDEAKQRQLRCILNKLTPQNFEILLEQVQQVNIDNIGTLVGFVHQIFDRAIMESIYCKMYAYFCYHLTGALPDFNEDNERITFKRLLVNKCQEEFEKGVKTEEEEEEEEKVRTRIRAVGNIRFIGELYKEKMLTEGIMHECINKLLGQYQIPDEEDVEVLCQLMSTIGEIIDHPKAKVHMDVYFSMMEKLSKNTKLSIRVRFMLKDTIDLRKNKWQQRLKVEGPKKIKAQLPKFRVHFSFEMDVT